jgi:AraC-like DNA-binding protein
MSSVHHREEYERLMFEYDRLDTEVVLIGEYRQLRLLSDMRGTTFTEILIRPLRSEKLAFSLQRIIDKIDARRASSIAPLRVENLWARTKPILLDQFWTELVYGKMPAIPLALEQAGRSVGLIGLDAFLVIPLLLSHDLRYGRSVVPRDLRFVYRAMMTEAVFTKPETLFSFAYDDDRQIVILRSSDAYANEKVDIAEACEIYRTEMAVQFNMDVACLVGLPSELLDLAEATRHLLKLVDIKAGEGKGIVFLEDVNDKEQDVLERAKRYIAAHIGEDISRDNLAENTNYSKNYLARIFRRRLGVSIFDYITQERMKLARKLLAGTNVPIARIAEKCGIPDAAYFSTLFKKSIGFSPKQYRKMNAPF